YGTWEMFDHNVPYGQGTSDSGLCDLMRRQKPSFWFYKSQSEKAPYVKLVADWQPGKATRRVVVFTNCDVASISVNGHSLGQKRSSATGTSTTYEKAKPFDGSNTVNLMHPPIIFDDVPYRGGALTVLAVRGKEQATDIIKTAGPADHLKIWVDDLGYPVGRNDLVFIRAAVVDKDGVICPTDSRAIGFTVTGAAFAGESSVQCEMGVASVLIRTPLGKTRIKVEAISKGVPLAKSEFAIN
ncbi:MAG: DUF4982 domain-containing protein, partial [Armatimonadota bacterium]